MNILYRICADLNLPPSWVMKVILRAPLSYKLYYIEKRNGGKRLIAQPAKDVKILQTWLVENIFNRLPVHESAFAYRKNLSIKDNAEFHKKNRFHAKFDFSNFFPSISGDDFKRHMEFHFSDSLSSEDIHNIIRICFRKEKENSHKYVLSIGAPSSPLISNSIMYEFDTVMLDRCQREGVLYTRYADDITLSTNKEGVLFKYEEIILGILSEISYPSLKVNSEKTIYTSKKNRRRITGLIITNDAKVSIGRERKRYISSQVHKFTLNAIPPDLLGELRGLLAYVRSVEPEFIVRLETKYGSEVIDKIIHS